MNPARTKIKCSSSSSLFYLVLLGICLLAVSCGPLLPNLPAGSLVIVYDANGADSGTVPLDANTYTSGAEVILAQNSGSLVKTGYVFSGWSLADDGSEEIYQPGQSYTLADTSPLFYAVWVAPDADFMAADYLDYSPGRGIRYRISDEYNAVDTTAWLVGQQVPAALEANYDYLVTLVRDVDDAAYLESALGGRVGELFDTVVHLFYGGVPSSNQGNMLLLLPIPVTADFGQSLTDTNYGSISISLSDAGSQTINWHEFAGCVRIDFTRVVDGSDYTNGSGFFILAPGVGMVQLEFTRADSGMAYANTTVCFEYIDHTQFAARTISGYLSTDGTTPAVGAYVQLANQILDTSALTDVEGHFSLSGVYGPDLLLRVGYKDNDVHSELLDFDYPVDGYPKEYTMRDVAADISGLLLFCTPTRWSFRVAPYCLCRHRATTAPSRQSTWRRATPGLLFIILPTAACRMPVPPNTAHRLP